MQLVMIDCIDDGFELRGASVAFWVFRQLHNVGLGVCFWCASRMVWVVYVSPVLCGFVIAFVFGLRDIGWVGGIGTCDVVQRLMCGAVLLGVLWFSIDGFLQCRYNAQDVCLVFRFCMVADWCVV